MVVVFDGPPPSGSPSREVLGQVTVLWSGAASADDVIVGSIPEGPSARQWTVITDDRGLAGRARRRGAATRTLADWRRKRPPAPKRAQREPKLSSREVEDWEAYFSSRSSEDE
jgi:hypothetical protein